ncbi:GAP family protein [Kocuria sp. cx-116]|uniref:GAP family protein n=1 Tax=Kocuria sp. cx-116 TaxID=2771378 RepID=UPI0016899DBE|nr:GAP family protein [Kocuria sp. cx-116]MBD2761989.1 GAP family protein [Kocuria sp. cx-116]
METLGILAVLALVDSTSFGTLLIPIWLLMAPGRLRTSRLLVYLATVMAAYFVIGVVVMLGATAFLDTFGDALESRTAYIIQLVLGIGLVLLSYLMDPGTKRAKRIAAERAAAGEAASSTGGRVSRWRGRILGADGAPADTRAGAGSLAALMGLALVGVSLEVATMVPYLAGIGIISSTSPSLTISLVLLAGYCLVMIAPALILTLGRLVARNALERPLSALDRWLTKNAQSTTSWIIGIVGVLLAINAFGMLQSM